MGDIDILLHDYYHGQISHCMNYKLNDKINDKSFGNPELFLYSPTALHFHFIQAYRQLDLNFGGV